MGMKKYQFKSMIGLFLHKFLANTVHFCNYKGNHCPHIHGHIRSFVRSFSPSHSNETSARSLPLSRSLSCSFIHETHKNAIKPKRLEFGFTTIGTLCCGRCASGVDYIRYEFIAES